MKTLFFCIAAMSLYSSLTPAFAVSIAQFNTAYSEDFNSLASTTTSSTTPVGWTFFESGSGGNTTYAAGTGSGTGGNTYSFGASGSGERALGSLQTGTVVPSFGVSFQNDSLSVISTLEIAYRGEQWRLGALGRADRLDFQYSLDATSLTSGTWNDFSALDFIAPITTGSAGALDGNAAANSASISGTLSGLNWSQGSTLWFRWVDVDASGSTAG